MTLLERYKAAKACWQVAKQVDPLMKARVRSLMAQAETRGFSGEWKRHQVYAQLIKDYPEVPHKHLALAIEIVKCFG